MITCVDDAIANITQALSDAGLWENSVLIFSSGNYNKTLFTVCKSAFCINTKL